MTDFEKINILLIMIYILIIIIGVTTNKLKHCFMCVMCLGLIGTVGTVLRDLSKSPKAIDVYRNQTKLEITYKDNLPIDSIVVFK